MSSPSRGSDAALVRRTAALARLHVTDEEAEQLGRQFGRILEAFRVLGELELDEDEEQDAPAAAETVLRDDEPRPSWPREALVERAPDQDGEHYRVPKTVGGDA